MGHYFEKEITKFLAEETDEDKRMLKTGFCDWFWKWELVDTGVSDLKKQVNILKFRLNSLFYVKVGHNWDTLSTHQLRNKVVKTSLDLLFNVILFNLKKCVNSDLRACR